MTREDQQGPRCRNSWRPSDRRPARRPEKIQQLGMPELHVPIQRSSQTWAQPNPCILSDYSVRSTSSTSPVTPEAYAQNFKNPNLIPVVPRRLYRAAFPSLHTGSQQAEELDEEHLPQIWHPSIDDLIRRTAHDYDLVMNYERDAEGGQRWLPEDIARIRDIGKTLHRDISALKRCQRVVAEQGDRNKDMMIEIKRSANLLKLLCERVQAAVNAYEQKREFELLRDGLYAQDEEGNFYKPTAPDVAEDGLQELARPDTEHGEASRAYEMYRRNLSTLYILPEYHNPSRPEGSQNLDSAFPEAPINETRCNDACPRSEVSRHSSRVHDSRIPKSYRDSASASHSRILSTTYPDEDPVLDAYLERIASDKQPRNRGRNNRYDRDGRSRRQAKRDRAQLRYPRPAAGRLGKHVLHY